MSQGVLFELTIPAPRGIGWNRYPTACRADHEMTVDGVPNGIWVRDCGHPTANRPYYIVLPDHSIVDRKYRAVADAKAAAIALCGSAWSKQPNISAPPLVRQRVCDSFTPLHRQKRGRK